MRSLWARLWLRACQGRLPVGLRRALRLAAMALVVLVACRFGLRFTPKSWWIDERLFTQPKDAFEVTDRHGQILRHARVDGVDRRWVPLSQIAPSIQDAFIAAEDARFRSHDGIDSIALARALVTSIRPWGRRSGASTITQQLVKRVYGRPYGLLSKMVEIGRAEALERTFTKEEILEQYLNRVPFGDRIEGVERASEEYFGHGAAEVSVAEAAMLAGIPQAPSATEPRRHFDRAKRRTAYVLDRMASLGFIDEEAREHAGAALPSIRVVPARPNEAPRFVEGVVAQYEAGSIDRSAGSAGTEVRTSLDLDLQRDMDATLASTVARFESRGVTNGASIVVANGTGEILAYTGAIRRGEAGGSLDLLAHPREPGSALKPFAYELFFERGGNAATILDDVTLPRTGALGATFDAKDYDGKERGPVRARVALSGSLNLAALDVAARVGQDALIERLRALGFRDVGRAEHYGAAAVLGGLDVAPVDLARAYVTLARGGTRVPLSSTERKPAPGERVLSAAACEVTRDVLSDAHARKDAFGADLVDVGGVDRFALKTGTSSGWRDAWAAVYDESFTVVVWLGDPGGRPLGGVSGFEAAAPTAARILGLARARAAADAVAPVDRSVVHLVGVAVCAESGLRAGPNCSHVIEERFAADALPTETCDAHDEEGKLVLPARYADWISRAHPLGIATASRAPDPGSVAPVVREPRDGARWLLDPGRGTPLVPLHAWVGSSEARDVTWEIDGARLDDTAWRVEPGDHSIVAAWKGRRSRPVTVHVEGAR